MQSFNKDCQYSNKLGVEPGRERPGEERGVTGLSERKGRGKRWQVRALSHTRLFFSLTLTFLTRGYRYMIGIGRPKIGIQTEM